MKNGKSTEKFGGISDDAVKAATGKTWKEWLAVLDKVGAKKLTHKEIVAIVARKHGVGAWWQQMVTVGYEQARGLREKHQSATGFKVSRSKTIASSSDDIFRCWAQVKLRQLWLPEEPVEIRKATRGKSVRAKWADGKSSVDVNFYPKGEGKTQVVVQHSKLSSAAQASRMKAFWGKRLEKLERMLEN